MMPKPSIAQARAWVLEQLAAGESPAADARVLLEDVLDCNSAYLLTWPERHLTEQQWQKLQEYVAIRLEGQPIAYIVGYREFWSLQLKVSPATLIPRPDTEILVEQALEKLAQLQPQSNQAIQILDLGTGTGAVALALASETPDAEVYACDLQADAVALAKFNAQALNLAVKVFQGSWFTPFEQQKFDLIVTNPPYIDPDDEHLSQGDVRFEPLSALTADLHGLADIQNIINQSRQHLNDGGWLLLEHGYDQADSVAAIFAEHGFQGIYNQCDYGGQPRVSGAQFVKGIHI